MNFKKKYIYIYLQPLTTTLFKITQVSINFKIRHEESANMAVLVAQCII